MRPLGHFLVAALPLLLYTVVRYRRLPRGPALFVVLAGTQLPDVIDKPLAWTFGILPSGRMLAHSLVIVVPVLALAAAVARRRTRRHLTYLFSMSYLSHIAGDFYPILWQGSSYYFFPNLFWPLLAANPDRAPSFAAHAPPSVASVVLTVGVFALCSGYAVYDVRRQSVPQ